MIEWKPISERMMYARFHTTTLKISIITLYAPTNNAADEAKENFIEQLDRAIAESPKHDILLVMGDFNAKVGMNNEGHENIMGKHGIAERNENGENLLDICHRNNLVVTGTIFPHKDKHKVTWISPNKKTENQIDHILVTKQHRTSVLDTRTMRGADIASDHELLRCKLRIKLKKHKVLTEVSRKRFDTTKLQRPEIRKAFSVELKNRFQCLDELEDVETFWHEITKCYKETATDMIGFKAKGHKPWISNESWKLVDERRQLKEKSNNSRSERLKNSLNAKYSDKDKEVKKSMRNDKRQWTDNLIDEAEKAASNGMMKTVYEITRTICNEKPKSPQIIKDKTGNKLSSQDEKLKRWKEHFEEVLNRPEPEIPIEANLDYQIEEIEIDTGPIKKEEILKALKRLKNGKSGGIDGITAEILKADTPTTTKCLLKLFNMIWIGEEIPKDWNKGLIIKIVKKGDTTLCDNYRGITLLSVPSKIFTKIIIQRIQEGIDDELRQEQAGFRKGKSTTEQLFTLRNIIEQCSEWNAPLYINFVDFEKAFDSIHRESLWYILKAYNIPDKVIRIIKLFYENFECAVVDEGIQSEWFKVKTGVKQGCVMSGFLFLLAIDYVMKQTTKDQETGIRWKFTTKLEDLDFADDIALLSSKFQHIQMKTNKLQENASKIGLKVNTAKTKIMRMNTTNTNPVRLNDKDLEDVDSFTYLGGVVTSKGGCDNDIDNRLKKAKGQFSRLRKIWRSTSLSFKTKVRLFNSLVLSVLLYGCETWKATEQDKKKLNTFQTRCLRQILKIRWPNTISNENLLLRAGTKKVSDNIMERRWRWLGHVLRMDTNRICSVALTWKPEGKRRVGRPKTTWRRTVEVERASLGWNTWAAARTTAKDRAKWKECIRALNADRHEEDR